MNAEDLARLKEIRDCLKNEIEWGTRPVHIVISSAQGKVLHKAIETVLERYELHKEHKG